MEFFQYRLDPSDSSAPRWTTASTFYSVCFTPKASSITSCTPLPTNRPLRSFHHRRIRLPEHRFQSRTSQPRHRLRPRHTPEFPPHVISPPPPLAPPSTTLALTHRQRSPSTRQPRLHSQVGLVAPDNPFAACTCNMPTLATSPPPN